LMIKSKQLIMPIQTKDFQLGDTKKEGKPSFYFVSYLDKDWKVM